MTQNRLRKREVGKKTTKKIWKKDVIRNLFMTFRALTCFCICVPQTGTFATGLRMIYVLKKYPCMIKKKCLETVDCPETVFFAVFWYSLESDSHFVREKQRYKIIVRTPNKML